MLHKELQQFGQVKVNEPLAKHTTFKIGGPADLYVIVEERNKLVELLRSLDNEGTAYIIIGGGSNTLAPDEGFRGVVIQVKTQTTEVKDSFLIIDAGYTTVAAAQLAIKHGLTGFEWGVGVPGTIGGAVRGNAGAMGGEMKDVVHTVEVYKDGEVLELTNQECAFGYRESVFKQGGGVVLSVCLKLQPEEEKAGMKKALEYLQYRNKSQPQGYASTGCIFKNVEIDRLDLARKNDFVATFGKDEKVQKFLSLGKISAGWLVEQAGMKGAQVGQALVSERHGNFVVNLGGAEARDVLALVEQIKDKVYDTIGVHLEEEMQIV